MELELELELDLELELELELDLEFEFQGLGEGAGAVPLREHGHHVDGGEKCQQPGADASTPFSTRNRTLSLSKVKKP